MTGAIHQLADATGRGIVAGLAGTIAVTALDAIAGRRRGHATHATSNAIASTVIGVTGFTDTQARQRLEDLARWGYATTWGLVRAALGTTRLTPRAANAVQGTLMWGTGQTLGPALDLRPLIVFQTTDEIVIGLARHVCYAVAAGVAYDRTGP